MPEVSFKVSVSVEQSKPRTKLANNFSILQSFNFPIPSHRLFCQLRLFLLGTFYGDDR